MATKPQIVRLLVCWATCLTIGVTTNAQVGHKSYSDFYNKNRSVSGINKGTNAYLYDKYFYRSPSVSPYLNLDRAGSDSADAYHLYVRPELQRREASRVAQGKYIQQRKMQGNVGFTQHPGAIANAGVGGSYRVPTPKMPQNTPAYYNQFYGNKVKR